jgi:cephalosporin-C deacetylase-like acetyl esterase
LVYDNRNFGESDGEPRHEIVPSVQQSDYSDAITYAQSLDDVNADKIGIWGSSYSGGHVLLVGATDRRVKAVLGQVYVPLYFHLFGDLTQTIGRWRRAGKTSIV